MKERTTNAIAVAGGVAAAGLCLAIWLLLRMNCEPVFAGLRAMAAGHNAWAVLAMAVFWIVGGLVLGALYASFSGGMHVTSTVMAWLSRRASDRSQT